MILVDSSIWIDHLRGESTLLSELLVKTQVLTHPFVIGEVALGSLRNRELILKLLQGLPQVNVASHAEVMHLIHTHVLHGAGIGYTDAHLLSAALLTPGSRLWTRDKHLLAAATRLNVANNHFD